MLAKNETTSLLKLLAIGSCGALFALAASADVARGSEGCSYSTQLRTDPEARVEYTVKVAMLSRSGGEEIDTSEIYESNIKVNYRGRSDQGAMDDLDSVSRGCLSCHDGAAATGFHVRVKNNPNNRAMSLEDIVGGHPVGMEYERYVSVKSREYRAEVLSSSPMVFANGRVGCITCHDPLNKKKGHLVMNNDRSELCFSCHSK